MKEALRDFRFLLVACFLYAAVVVGAGRHYGVGFDEYLPVFRGVFGILKKCLGFIMAFCMCVSFVGFFSDIRNKKGFAFSIANIWHSFDKRINSYIRGQAVPYLVLSLAVLCCNSFFYIYKSIIPHINAYHWDALFFKIDRILHFGYSPHSFVIPLSDRINLSYSLDIAYYGWFLVMYSALCYNLFFDADLHRRMRFIWIFFLSWVLIGSLLATVFSSVGPVFYSDFYPAPDLYADLKAHFNENRGKLFIIAATGYDLLLGWAKGDKIVNPNAISAMPSMHVAIAFLIVLYAREINKYVFGFAVMFCALILIGSVYFGFHYAIDGYVSIILISVLWWGVGKCLDRKYPRSAKHRLKIFAE